MNILVSGSTGLVGKALLPYLTAQGHTVRRLVRSGGSATDVTWDPMGRGPDPAKLEGIDAVVHLAGESIMGRWTEEKKRRIRESRRQGTRLLSEAIAKMSKPPTVMVSASAIGYYGGRGSESLTEESAPGQGFLTEVCQEWEAATQAASDKGVRVVHPRIGIVLSPNGGALAQMLLPFRLGVGGKIGSGSQYMSWIALDDLIGIIGFALKTENLRGAVNATAPKPETNADYTRTLGKVLHRPTIFPMPAFAAKLAFGEMGETLLLEGARVLPARLAAAGYPFRYPELEGALRHLLG